MQTTQKSQINFVRAFSFIFEDTQWVSKTLIGALFVLLSVFILPVFVIFGYYVQLIRNVATGNPRPLPEWDNIGDKFMQGLSYGLKMIGVFLVYALPAIILQVVGQVLITAGSNGESLGLVLCLVCL